MTLYDNNLIESKIAENEIETDVEQFNKILIFLYKDCIPLFKVGCD